MMSDSWALFGTEPRDARIKIMNEVISAINDGYHNIIINAGTGIGKSAIAVTLANHYRKNAGWSSYILTRTTQLQEQYLEDFSYLIGDLQGKSNYKCNYADTCDDCKVLDYADNGVFVETECDDCKYITARNTARESKITTMNYIIYYFMCHITHYFPQKDLLILDEAHKLESTIMSIYETSISDKFLKEHLSESLYSFGLNTDEIDESDVRERLKELKNSLNNELSSIRFQISAIVSELGDVVTEERRIQLYAQNRLLSDEQNKLKSLGFKLHEILLNDVISDNYVWMYDDSYKKNPEFVLKPIDVRKQAKSFLDKAHTRIFLTATIGNKDLFTDWLGLDSNDSYLIEADSPFKVENRPIYLNYGRKMSGYNPVKQRQNWKTKLALDTIYEIINKHGGERGCIHTVSNAQTSFITDFLDTKNISYINVSGKDRNKLLNEYIENDGIRLLIGSAIKDGVDLKDELCRFQILFKIPYPYLGDKQIKARMNRESVWYTYQTVMDLLQAYGRGIRNEDDYCSFYVLDSDIKRLLKTNRDLFSRYFLEAIQE